MEMLVIFRIEHYFVSEQSDEEIVNEFADILREKADTLTREDLIFEKSEK